MRLRAFSSGLAAVVILSACGSATATHSSYPSTLKIALSTVLQSFDPIVAQPLAKLHLDLMYDHLVGTNANETAVSTATGVASNWTTSDDLTWNFTIRKGLEFSDGEPINAQDVQFSLDRLLTKAATAAYATYFQSEKMVVTVTSSTTLTIVLATPSFALPIYLSSIMGNEGDVVPEAYIQQHGSAYFALHPIGSGPYKLESVTPGVSILYQLTGRRDPLIAGTPHYQTIEFDTVTSDATRVALLQSGGADMIDIGDISELKTLSGSAYRIEEKPGSNVIGVGLAEQWKSTPSNNKDFREALALAINASAINTAFFDGKGSLTGIYPVGTDAIGYQPITPYAYDPTMAKSLLQQSGYSGQPISLYAWAQSGLPDEQDVSQAILQYWTTIGVKVNLVNTDQATYIGKWVTYNLGFSASAVAIANRPLALSVYQGQFFSKGSSTYTHDPSIDSLVGQMVAGQSSTQTTSTLTQQMNQYIHDNYLTIPLFQLGSFYAVKSSAVPNWQLGGGQYDINIRAMITAA